MVLSIFSCACWPFVCLLCKNVYSGSLPISKLGCLVFDFLGFFFVCLFLVLVLGGFFFCLLRAAPVAHGGSQARGLIRAVAAAPQWELLGFFSIFIFLSCLSSYTLWILTPCQVYQLQSLLFFSRLAFHFFDGFLCWKKLFSLMQSHLCIFASVAFAWGGLSKNIRLRSSSKSLLPKFVSGSFMLSDLTFKSLILFEFIFVYDVRKWSSFILLHVNVQFSQHNLLKKRIIFVLCSCLLCCRLIDNVSLSLFLASVLFYWCLCLFLCQYYTMLIISRFFFPSRLLWLFMVFYDFIQILGLFVLFLWKMS